MSRTFTPGRQLVVVPKTPGMMSWCAACAGDAVEAKPHDLYRDCLPRVEAEARTAESRRDLIRAACIEQIKQGLRT
jgi:hypothetical protein